MENDSTDEKIYERALADLTPNGDCGELVDIGEWEGLGCVRPKGHEGMCGTYLPDGDLSGYEWWGVNQPDYWSTGHGG